MADLRLHLIGCDPATQKQVRRRFECDGVRVEASDVFGDMLSAFGGQVPDVVLLDADHDSELVVQRLGELKSECPELPVILFAGEADMPLVVDSMRSGAFDFVAKPLDLTRLDIAIKNASQLHRLMLRVNQLQERSIRNGSFQNLVGQSPCMRQLYDMVEHVSRTDVTVFITGQSGTGKELIARAVHDLSDRRSRNFVAVNCASIPRDLLESELFGHEKGAFTGAHARYIGSCEHAAGGTLFLDEICEMDPQLQSKMLRFLQSRTFRRLGSTEQQHVDVRILAATNREPLEEIRKGQLREDLYYRLNVVPIQTPALSARTGDIGLLANHFLSKLSAKYGKYFYDFAPEALQALEDYTWPGNVRELENVVERVVVLNNGSQVTTRMLPENIVEHVRAVDPAERSLAADEILPFTAVEEREITRALRICGWNVSRAAQRLELGQATLYRKIKKYGIELRRRPRDTAVQSDER